MSDAEHLIENALMAMKEKGMSEEAWNQFRNHHATEAMSKATGIKPEYVWDMATYVILSWMRNTMWELEGNRNRENECDNLRAILRENLWKERSNE